MKKKKSQVKRAGKSAGLCNAPAFITRGSAAESLYCAGKSGFKKFQKRNKRDVARAVAAHKHSQYDDEPTQEQSLAFRAGRAIGGARRAMQDLDPRRNVALARERFSAALHGDEDQQAYRMASERMVSPKSLLRELRVALDMEDLDGAREIVQRLSMMVS
jgi:hypothetical protein